MLGAAWLYSGVIESTVWPTLSHIERFLVFCR